MFVCLSVCFSVCVHVPWFHVSLKNERIHFFILPVSIYLRLACLTVCVRPSVRPSVYLAAR